MADLFALYHHLPGPVRTAAATVRGLYLRSCRYSAETPRLVSEALEREHWRPERWKAWQEERLEYVLHRAATQVPYYREQWAARRRAGDSRSWCELANWPILEKEALRTDPTAFVADDCDVRHMIHEHTSGTTGKALTLFYTRETMCAWYALFEARWRRWYGVSRDDRWANIGGQIVVPVDERHPPFWVWNGAFHQLYMSSYHLAPDLIPSYLDALQRYRIAYLYGYTSSLYALALEALRLGRKDLPMRVAITNAEPVADYQREVIAEAFQCPVRETYGMSEMVAGASECDAGHLHLWPEAGWLEILEDGRPVADALAGEMICTGLFNADMPLIRYRVGDRGKRPADDTPCPCGRTLPRLASIEGRCDDVLYTADGRRIGRLDPVFKAGLPIREAQIIQETLHRIRVRYVPSPEFSPEAARAILARIQARMGKVEVILEALDELPRGANGKFRAVISELSRSEAPSCE